MSEIWWLLLGLTGLTLILHLVARLLYVSVAARMFGQTPWLPSGWREPLPEGEPVTLTTADGVRLDGTYLPSTAPVRQGVLACCHELNGDRWNVLPHVEGLRRDGFDVFLFDFRNHGTSGRTAGYDPLPWASVYELADVRAAVDYLCARPDAPAEGVGLFGLSRGGTAALCEAADDPRVRAVVVEGLCPTERMQVHRACRYLDRTLRSLGRRLRIVPEASLSPLGAWTRLIIGWRRRCRFVNVEQSARRVRQPVLLIHGECDPHVPVEAVRALYEVMSPCTKLWVVPRGKHTGAAQLAVDEYRQRTTWFFREHLEADRAHLGPADKAARFQPAEARTANSFEQASAF